MLLEGLSGGIIVAIVDFLMVFLVLVGLAGVLIVMRRTLQLWEKQPQEKASSEEIVEGPEISLPAPQKDQTQTHLAAITAAIQEFTSLPPGAFQINSVEPLEYSPVATEETHIAAITAAVQDFTGLPEEAFQIDFIEPIAETAAFSPAEYSGLPPHFVAMAAALHEYLATPPGSFRIVSMKPAGSADTWKMAGRLELMGLDRN